RFGVGRRVRSYPALAGLRIGCVQYLNSKPLIHGFDGPVIFDHPSGLARDLIAGKLDVALVPTFEALRTPHYTLAEDVGIACDGPVYSVFLAHRGPLTGLRRVALDPASLTSVHLLQVLLREYHGVRPELCALSEFPAKADAALIIGNQAIEFRQQDQEGYEILDLGEEWKRCTGLPFVFAPWLLRPDLPNAKEVADDLRALKAHGLAHLDDIIRAELRDPAFTRCYLTEHIRFVLGDREKAGIAKYRELLAKHGFIADAVTPLRYA
ncbi:MAG TPA: menaquinone biosynthesis protein, partial [Chthoniobacter sp.]|nr:menaquinone biosynthesis protein [Chthoniobacter sp.]